MYLKKITLLLITGVAAQNLAGMITPPVKQVRVVTAPSKGKPTYLTKELISMIRVTYAEAQDPSQSTLCINANIITDPTILDNLILAHQNGVSVQLLLSQDALRYAKKNKAWLAFLKKPAFQFKVFADDKRTSVNHAKFVLCGYIDKKGKEQHLYSVGSANFTFNGEYHSNEATELVANDTANYEKLFRTFNALYNDVFSVDYDPRARVEDLYRAQQKGFMVGELDELNEQNFIEPSDYKNQPVTPEHRKTKPKILQETPADREVYSTFECKVWESIAHRLDRYDIVDKPGGLSGSISISSMTWNAPAFTHKLIEARENNFDINIVIDKAALLGQSSRQQLKSLMQSGVNIFCYFGDGFKLQHAKFALIEKNVQGKGKKIICSTTQNVSCDNNDVDIMTVDPENTALFQEYKTMIQELLMHQNMQRLTKQNFNDAVQKVKNIRGGSLKGKTKKDVVVKASGKKRERENEEICLAAKNLKWPSPKK